MRTVGLIFPPEESSEIFRCPHCGKEYKSEAALDKHIRDKHPDASDDANAGGDPGSDQEE